MLLQLKIQRPYEIYRVYRVYAIALSDSNPWSKQARSRSFFPRHLRAPSVSRFRLVKTSQAMVIFARSASGECIKYLTKRFVFCLEVKRVVRCRVKMCWEVETLASISIGPCVLGDLPMLGLPSSQFLERFSTFLLYCYYDL